MKKYFLIGFLALSHLFADCLLSDQRPFIAKGNEVVDTQTKRIWRRCPLGQTWQAKKGCIGHIERLNHKEAEAKIRALGQGWRLPSMDELMSLVEKRCKSPMINEALFGKMRDMTDEGTNYLSQTVYMQGDGAMPTLFYTIDFVTGNVDAHTKSFSGAVRLVR